MFNWKTNTRSRLSDGRAIDALADKYCKNGQIKGIYVLGGKLPISVIRRGPAMKKDISLGQLAELVSACLDKGVEVNLAPNDESESALTWTEAKHAAEAAYAAALEDVLAAIRGDKSALKAASSRSIRLDRSGRLVEIQLQPHIARTTPIETQPITGYGSPPCTEVEAGLQDDLIEMEPSAGSRLAVNMRVTPRGYLNFALTVYDTEVPQAKAQVHDITEQGVGVAGLEAKIDEVRTLEIMPDEVFELEPITFEARCRWGKTEGTSGRYFAGFEITNISEASLHRLRDLIRLLTPAEWP